MTKTRELPADFVLSKGAHSSPEQGLCYVEWLAWMDGQPHTDRPPCVSPLLGDMGRSLNDTLPDEPRQLLLSVVGTAPLATAGDGHDETRSYMALDWLIRTWLPAWLDLVPTCREDAVKIRALSRIVDPASAERAGPVVRAANATASAADSAAYSALAPTVETLQESAITLYAAMARVGATVPSSPEGQGGARG